MSAAVRPPAAPVLREWRCGDGHVLRGRLWPGAPGLSGEGFLYLHGIQSHGGWFEGTASLLAEGGRPVLLPDRRGSGLNAVARGDVPAAERWLADLDELADWARAELGVAKLALVGVSWGGKLALAWALRRPAQVSRLLLIAPGLFPAVDVGRLRRVAVAGALLAGGGGSRFAIPLNDPALFTDNPARRAYIASDPLRLMDVTARFLFGSYRLDRTLAAVPAGALAIPITLLLAGRDRIIRNAPTRARLAEMVAGPLAVHLFPAAAHTLEFEEDAAPLFARVREFARLA